MGNVESTEKKVRDFIDKHSMILPGDRVVAGVSGGADSVCLLFVLLAWMKEISFDLHVVHVNHLIRSEAGKDAAFVEALCISHKIPFTLVEKDVRTMARKQKRSEEEMGRLVRYGAFEEVRKRIGANKIAVAHNSNDLAETMLFHLFRGTGLSGLCGIRPVRGHIIRPIMCLERCEIEAYLDEKGVRYCQDITNEGDDYTRNRIRHHILPYAEEAVSEGCINHMRQTAEMLLETEGLLERLTCDARKNTVTELTEACFRMDCAAYDKLDPAIGRRLLYETLCRLSPGGRDIGYVHVQDVEKLFLKEGNRRLCLPYGINVRRQYGDVIFEREEKKESEDVLAPAGVTLQQDILEQGEVQSISFNSKILHFQVFSGKNFEDIPQNRYTKWFDYDKIEGLLTVRVRETGDFLSIRGAKEELVHKSVKDYMVTEKIPAKDRDRILLIAAGQHVLWLVGYRISEYYKVSKNTKRVLQVQLRRDCDCSEMEENNGRTCEGNVD